jgi:aryl-alcohol dehydrogenase-like predicted oxidoreductase
VLEALRAVAAEVDRPPAQVALARTLARPGVASLILGASRVDQLRDNIAALSLTLTAGQTAALDKASAPEGEFFTPGLKRIIFGGADVRG